MSSYCNKKTYDVDVCAEILLVFFFFSPCPGVLAIILIAYEFNHRWLERRKGDELVERTYR